MTTEAKPLDVLVKVPVTFNVVSTSLKKPHNVLYLSFLCATSVNKDSAPLDVLERHIKSAYRLPAQKATYFVADMTTFHAMRVLHLRGVIRLRVVFISETDVEYEVCVHDNGRLSQWPSSVLDRDAKFLDELIGD